MFESTFTWLANVTYGRPGLLDGYFEFRNFNLVADLFKRARKFWGLFKVTWPLTSVVVFLHLEDEAS